MPWGGVEYDGVWNKNNKYPMLFKQGVFNQTDVIIQDPPTLSHMFLSQWC